MKGSLVPFNFFSCTLVAGKSLVAKLAEGSAQNDGQEKGKKCFHPFLATKNKIASCVSLS